MRAIEGEFEAASFTGIQLPELALGTWKYRGGPEPLRAGIELGTTFIDTAESYSTEPVVAEAIRENCAASLWCLNPEQYGLLSQSIRPIQNRSAPERFARRLIRRFAQYAGRSL